MQKRNKVSGARRLSRYLTLLWLLYLLSSHSGFAAPLDYGVKIGVESFLWEEFGGNGSKLLKESGTRYALSGFLGNTIRVNRDFIHRAEAKLYFGKVNYDGQTQDRVPASSDTNYSGFLLEAEAGYRATDERGKIAWDFIGRVGFDSWIRSIENTTDVSGRRVSGMTERFMVLNMRAGTGPYWHSGRWQGRFIAGFKLPLLTKEYISKRYTGYEDDVLLEPKGRISPFLNFYHHIRLSDQALLTFDAYYDAYRFDASDSVVVSKNGSSFLIWQPKSSQDNYGLQAGVSFSF